MSQQTLGWKPLQIIHHYFPRDEKKMEAFIDANPGDGFVVNVKEPWNDPNDHAGYDTYLRAAGGVENLRCLYPPLLSERKTHLDL